MTNYLPFSSLLPIGKLFFEEWGSVETGVFLGKKEFTLKEVLQQTTFDDFKATCSNFIERYGNTFENCLKCVLLYIELFSCHFPTVDVHQLRRNPDFSQINRGKWFMELMDTFVKPHLKGLDMNKPLTDQDADEATQVKRQVYAAFSAQFVAHRNAWFNIECEGENSWVSPAPFLTIKFEKKSSFERFHYFTFLNKLNLFMLGVDYYDFYFPKPTAKNDDFTLDNSPMNIFFHRLAHFWYSWPNETDVELNQGLIQFFLRNMAMRGRVFEEDPSHEFEKDFMMVRILINDKVDFVFDKITFLKSPQAIALWDHYEEKLLSEDYSSFSRRADLALEIRTIFRQTEGRSWPPIESIRVLKN
jgi:hypothetical protein